MGEQQGAEHSHRPEFDGYVERMIRIRELSTPQIEKIATADAYCAILSDNFRRIGELAAMNRQVISETIDPILQSEELLPTQLISQIRTLNENLMDAITHENIDLSMMTMLSGRLKKDALKKSDDAYLIRQLDEEIVACIALAVQTRRIVTLPELGAETRWRGTIALNRLMKFLEPEEFRKLDPESRELVMINSRYGDGIFITMVPLTQSERDYRFRLVERSIACASDPFYREMLPDYDWNYHVYRAYQYISSYDEFDNCAGFTESELQRIADIGERLEQMCLDDPDGIGKIDRFSYIHAHTLRNRMHAGRISPAEYRQGLYELYRGRSTTNYDVDEICDNIEIPREYLASLDPETASPEEQQIAAEMYRDCIAYVFRMPKIGTFYELMDYYAPLLFVFKEVPCGITFEEMGLQAFAAIHPPTYIHSYMVAQISKCLIDHLIRRRPELFVGVLGVTTPEEARERAEEIESFTYHAALCHDFGKLIIIDTVSLYGRKILDTEFNIIRQHPQLGAMLLSKHPSTKAYVDVALGHHIWYDGSAGYPLRILAGAGTAEDGIAKSPLKTIIDIVACADCMDAATDNVGRSYKNGKSLETYIEEVREGAGTRYAPYLPELLDDPEVRKDLQELLTEGRRDDYRSTFELLRKVHRLA